jgi:type I restriction enzyme S subunit
MSQVFPLRQIKDAVLKVESWNPVRDGADRLINYIDLGSVDQNTKTVNPNEPIIASSAPSRARQLVQARDVLVSTVRPNLNGVAVVDSSLDRATASTGFCVLRPDTEKIDGSYLFHWVKTPSFISDMVRKATGASYPAVSDRIVFESRIPLPPIAEQKRIAAILDKAEELRELRRQALRELDAIAQSIFIEMFGDPATNPYGLILKKLEDIFLFRTGKLNSNASNPSGKYPFFTCSRDDFWIDEYAFDCEALLLAGNNANADYSVKYYKGKFNAYQRTYVINLRDEESSYEFAKAALEYQLGELKRVSKGSNTKYLTLEILNQIRIPMPSVSSQKEFSRRIESIEQLKTTHRESLAKLDALFASLQHRAFRGEL